MREQRTLSEILRQYETHLISKVGKVRILGESNERDLNDVFVELRVVAQEKPDVAQAKFLGMVDSAMRRRFNPFMRRAGRDDLSAIDDRTSRRVRPLDLLDHRSRAIVAGMPGSGKTTLLKFLALQAIRSQNRFVIWLELKAVNRELFASAASAAADRGCLILEELWLRHSKSQLMLIDDEVELLRSYWRDKYQANQLAVLLDGFDEIEGELIQENVNNCVRDFVSALHDNTFLISTRPYALGKLGKERLEQFEIQSLTKRQVKEFLNCYYPNDIATSALLRKLQEQDSLQELIRVPLLLGIILRLQRSNKLTDGLGVYEAIVVELTQEMDRTKSVVRPFRIPDDRLRLDFAKFLAFQKLLKETTSAHGKDVNRIVFDYDALRRIADTFLRNERLSHSARDLVEDTMATPLLRQVAHDAFAFTHLTLQEYLAASALAVLYDKNPIDAVTIFCRAYHNPTVVEMEVLPMAFGLVSNADDLYVELERWPESPTFANLRLRGRGLAYPVALSDEVLLRTTNRIAEILIHSTNEEEPCRRIILKSVATIKGRAQEHLENKIIPSLQTYSGFEGQKAAEALSVLGSERSFEPLLRALDPHATVRGYITTYIGRFDDQRVNYLCRALARIDPQKAAPILASISTSYSYGAIDRILREIGTTDTSRALLYRQTKVGHGLASGAARDLFRESETQGVMETLREALTHRYAEYRGVAVEALGNIGSDEYVDQMCERLFDSDFSVRWKTAQALGRIGSDKAVRGLLQALKDDESSVRWSAALALQEIGSLNAVAGLIDALRDPDAEVRYCAASALGRLGDPRALDSLLLLLEEGGIKPRLSAAYALAQIGDPKAIDPLRRLLLTQEDDELRAAAAYALGRIGADAAVDQLTTALSDEAAKVRKAAALALGSIGSHNAVASLLEAFRREKDFQTADAYLEAMGHSDSREVVEPLLACYASVFYIHTAAQAFGKISTRNLASMLPKLIHHENATIRRKAVEEISYFVESPEILQDLSKLAETDSLPEVRTAAKDASDRFARKLELFGVRIEECIAQALRDNESRELFLLGEAFRVVAQAGHIFRPMPNSDWGIDGEIEFKNELRNPTGQRLYLQLKSGDSYLYQRRTDGREIFRIKNPRHAHYWTTQAYPVWLVVRNSDGRIRWMNVTEYLEKRGTDSSQIEFDGEPFNPENVRAKELP